MTRDLQPAETLAAALDRYSTNSHDSHDFDVIYSSCLRIAIGHVRFIDRYTPGGFRSFFNSTSLESEAASYIGKLFCPPREGGLNVLARVWRSLTVEQKLPATEAIGYLINVIRSVVGQQRIESFRQSRPQEWRVRRNLRLHIQRSQSLQLIRGNGDLLIVGRQAHTHGWIPFPEDILRSHCYASFSGDDDLKEMVAKIEPILRADSLYNCVRFESFAQLVIAYFADVYAAFDTSVGAGPSAQDQELETIVQSVLERLKTKIENTYAASGKIEAETASVYLAALEAFLRDLLHTGSNDSQFAYLSGELPDMNPEQFTAEHKARFGYLVVEMKAMLESAARDYLESNRAAGRRRGERVRAQGK